MAYENLDHKLVNSLLGDGRASLRSLGKELDVSVTTVSNHLHELEAEGAVQGYSPIVDYDKLGYDVTAVLQLKVEGHALPEIAEKLRQKEQMVTVYEVTGDADIIAVGKFTDTDGMNDQIKSLLTDADIRESNTNVVLNAVTENEQFELDVED
ncbi:HTH-type transcriptional regulator Lrp [Halorubrum kocurii]|uniref:AsnC family transcriptional regulator n=1 Tax=Halorubrum kocurii JCM 14978 TaxID=1230456 RepID=M0PLA6_9EURY|nr:HTH-type transcriptional regulator Lrp [Halorubrum kocurii]EMA70414.1 AsnC family transcriptional regulator [Halorubrum kocurii JCM 14978]